MDGNGELCMIKVSKIGWHGQYPVSLWAMVRFHQLHSSDLNVPKAIHFNYFSFTVYRHLIEKSIGYQIGDP